VTGTPDASKHGKRAKTAPREFRKKPKQRPPDGWRGLAPHKPRNPKRIVETVAQESDSGSENTPIRRIASLDFKVRA
jgi:hypothetical protein